MKRLLAVILAVALMAALAVNTFALEFTPSVAQKPAPEVLALEGFEDVFPDRDVYGIVYDKNDDILYGMERPEIVITPLSDDPTGLLTVAVKDISEAPKIADLSPDLEITKDYVVTDMFDVWVNDVVERYLAVPDNYIYVEFAYDGTELPVVLSKCTGVWLRILPENMEVSNGRLRLKLYDVCPFVILRTPTKDSPKTGSSFPIFEVIALVALAAGTVVIYKHLRKAL